ncbi:MAG: CocE/NonD family hydrolase [Planctomycetota bacterium]|nr:CocE/NonD family hydrolase [Planctomycetota bacterium]
MNIAMNYFSRDAMLVKTVYRLLLLGFAFSFVFDFSNTLSNRSTRLVAEEPLQLESYIRLHYTKHEYMVPMRDGVKLMTSVFVPKDTTKQYPFLIKRTPYSVRPYGEDKYPAKLGPSEHFVKANYIFVNQDVRGRFASEGEFVHVTPHITKKSKPTDVDESSDTFDTIEWLLKNVSNHNGRVGMYGISYPGFYAAAGMIDAHPALKAVSPQAPIGDWYFDDFLHHGSFFLAHAFKWLALNSTDRPVPTTEPAKPYEYPTPDGYKMFLEAGSIESIDKQYLKGTIPFWKEMMQHPNRDDFWQKRAIIPHLKNVAPAVMTVTGWYDAEDLYGSFKTYQSIEKQNPNVSSVLVVGPWHHGGWTSTDGDKLGKVSFGSKTAAFYRSEIELPFFEKHLKEKDVAPLSEATVFETGSNVWRTFDRWPPVNAEAKQLFTHEGGRLGVATPIMPKSTNAFDEFISDPNKPVPYSETITPEMTIEYMVDDQRFASRRPDVVTYQTDAFTEDMVIAGPIEADLWVSTTGTDADWIVKLIDVHPDAPASAQNVANQMGGYQMLIRSEVIRGRFRNDYAKPEPFVSGEPTRVRVELLDVLHRFQKGHRLMVQIQSTWFPLVDRNPQTYVSNIYFAPPDSFKSATHRIFRTVEHPTSLKFGVLPKK